jgi:amidohydrolase
MTCLLGTIKLLSENRDWFNGSIKFIFQPAEETLPGGALKMIEDGVLENPKPDLIIGQHVFPELESGKVGVRSGPYMASTDELNLTISGRGGHGALPQTFDDTIHTAAELIHKIKEKVNEKAPTDYPTVLSFGKIVADGAYNIIPKEVIIKGTFRTFDENWRKIVHKIIKTIATEISAKHNTNCDVFINSGYPVLENDKQLAILFEKNAIEYLGEQNVEILDMRTTGEDFARFTQLIPGVFYRLGIANKKQGINSRLHSPTFDIDESSIEIGTGIMIWNTIMTSLDDSY